MRWRRYGAAALATALLPVGLGADGGLMLWDLLGAGRWLEGARALAPLAFGLGLVALSFAPRIGRLAQSGLACAALTVAASAFTGSPVAFEQSFRGLLDFVGRRPLLVVLGLVLLSAGSELSWDDGLARTSALTRRLARALLVAGSALLVLVYLLPQRGSPYGLALAQSLAAAARYGGLRVVAGRVLFWLLELLPLLLAARAVLSVARRSRPGGWLGWGSRYGLSALSILLGLPLLAGALDPQAVLLQVRMAVLLGVAIGVGSRVLEAAVHQLLDPPLPPGPSPSTIVRDLRLRERLRARLEPPADDAQPLDCDLAEPPCHPWLAWLVRRRLDDLASELGARAGQVLEPCPATARQYLALLDGRWPAVNSVDGAAEPRSSGDRISGDPADVRPGWNDRVALWVSTGRVRLPVASALIAALVAGLVAVARCQPAPQLAWQLGPPSALADQLLGVELPRYVVALARQGERRSARQPSGQATVEASEQAQALVSTARRLDAELGRQVEGLVHGAAGLDRTGWLWLDAVHGVNRRIRDLGLPYYVDGNALHIGSRHQPLGRTLFYVTTFRVERVRRFTSSGGPYAALHVRRLDRLNVGGSRLGAVRPDEPFALVMLDTIERTVDDRIDELQREPSPSCGLPSAEIDELCGRALRAQLAASGLALGSQDARNHLVAQQTNATERHELQHQIDGLDVDIPGELYRLAPRADDRSLRVAAQELSASLAELATDDGLAATWALADLCTHLLSERAAGAYHYAAIVATASMLERPVVDDTGRVHRAPIEALWRQLGDPGGDPGGWLAPRARRAHRQLFGAPVAALSEEP